MLKRKWVAVACMLTMCAEAFGGSATTKSGRVIYGEIIEDNEKEVVVSSTRNGMVAKIALPRAEIASVDRDAKEPAQPEATKRPAAAGPVFFPLPLVGVVGKEITAASLAAGIAEARVGKAERIILMIDTGGGSIDESIKILDVLAGAQDLRPFAHVRRALSAGAIIAVGCPTIVLEKGATIGAAVPFLKRPDGLPKAEAAKYLSATIARCRAVAESAGHSPLVVQGMMDMNLVLSVVEADGKKVVVEGVPAGGTQIKKAGEILTMTAAEALACGLSAATAESAQAISAMLGVADNRQINGRGWGAVAAKSKTDRKEEVYKEVKAEKAARAEEARRRLQPQIEALRDKLEAVKAEGRVAESKLADILADQQDALDGVEQEFRAVERNIVLSGGGANQILAAKDVRDAKRRKVVARFAATLTLQREQINTLAEGVRLITRKLDPLVDELKASQAR